MTAGRVLRWLAIALQGLAVGAIAAIGTQCLMNWRHGESPDPRCVQRWKGYVEVHALSPGKERVTCEYRPEISDPRPGKS